MLFWLICLALAAAVAATILLPLLRGGGDGSAGATDIDIYRDQLAEVDRDLARGTLDASEADRARTEIARRLLAADSAGAAEAGTTPPPGLTRGTVAIGAVGVVAGGLALYAALGAADLSGPYPDIPRAERLALSQEMRDTRPGQAAAEATARVFAGDPPDAPEDYLEMVARLREIVPNRPDDLQGWRLLAQEESRVGNFPAAARAQERVIALLGPDREIADLVRLADLMVGAAGGYVSPETEAVLQAILREAPDNPAALYYLGLLYAETDRPDLAFRFWRRVVEDGPPGAIHTELARGQIADAAFRAGIEYAVPEAPAGGGTTQADIVAMVDRLSDRLATEGGPAEDWARLITSFAVLGDREAAATILAEAREVFAGSEIDLATLEAAAIRAGLDE